MKDPIRAPRDIRRNAWDLVASLAILWLVIGPALTLGLYRLARGVMDREPVLHIDDEGVLDRRLKVGLIPWEQITTMQRTRRGLMIGLSDPVRMGLRHSQG